MARDLAEELERNIPLSEMIHTLRRELQVSMAVSEDEDLRFEVPEVEVELKIAIARSRKLGGKVAFWVVEAGAGAEKSAAQVHTFRLRLRPVSRGRAPVQVADLVDERPE